MADETAPPNPANAPLPAPAAPANEHPATATTGEVAQATPQAPIGVNAPDPEKLQPVPYNADDPQGERSTPFAGEQQVMRSGTAMRDDISATQMSGRATRDVSSNHLTRLLYRPIDQPGGPVYQSQQLERRLKPDKR